MRPELLPVLLEALVPWRALIGGGEDERGKTEKKDCECDQIEPFHMTSLIIVVARKLPGCVRKPPAHECRYV